MDDLKELKENIQKQISNLKSQLKEVDKKIKISELINLKTRFINEAKKDKIYLINIKSFFDIYGEELDNENIDPRFEEFNKVKDKFNITPASVKCYYVTNYVTIDQMREGDYEVEFDYYDYEFDDESQKHSISKEFYVAKDESLDVSFGSSEWDCDGETGCKGETYVEELNSYWFKLK